MTLPGEDPNIDGTLTTAIDSPTLQVGSTTARLVATGTLTEGRYGLFRWEMAAAPGGASPHYHRTFSEAFYVLQGVVGLFDGTEWREGRPGDFLYLPPGAIHGFRNESGAAATMLILFAPAHPGRPISASSESASRPGSSTPRRSAGRSWPATTSTTLSVPGGLTAQIRRASSRAS